MPHCFDVTNTIWQNQVPVIFQMLMVSTPIGLNGFPRVVTIFVFNSWCMYYFCGALMSVFTAFLCVFASYWYFILHYVLLLFLLDIRPCG